MTCAPRRQAARCIAAFGAFVLLAAALLGPADAHGQRPVRRPPIPPPDTVARPDTLVRRDTTAVEPRDSVAAAVPDSASPAVPAPAAPDTTPIPQLPRLYAEAARDGEAGVWTWDQMALLASGALTLTDLLERIPGVTGVRYGFVGLPETVASLGSAGNIELVLDGYVIDPLGAAALDLSRIELAELGHVRVERRLGGLRVEVESLSPRYNAPYSRIEAGTGYYRTNLLRGLFLTPHFLGGSVGLGVERLASEAFGEPTENFSGWAQWTLTGSRLGLQVEYRRGSISRQGEAFGRFSGRRDDVVLRTRAALAPGLAAEAYVGRSTLDDGFHGLADTATVREAGVQAGLRAAYQGGAVRATTSLRARTERGLPALDGEVSAGTTLGGLLALDGALRLTDWREGQRAASATVRAQAGPFFGVRPVAEWFSGKSGTPWLADTAGVPILTDRSGYRAGVEAAYGRLSLSAAGVVLEADAVPDPAVALGQPARLFPGGRVEGLEVAASIPTPWKALALEGAYSRWRGGDTWIYLPVETGRVGLALHTVPLSSGNLELIARLEARHRGAMAVPGFVRADGGGAGTGDGTGADETAAPPLILEVVPAVTTFDFYFQLRIKDVRAFVRWENLANQPFWDVPGRLLPGQRLFYGVKWHFLD